jgi:ABC-type branched-subunit amino acid transport system substrate-binding protein
MLPIVNSLIDAVPDSVYFMGWSNEEAAAFITEVEAAPSLEDTPVFVWNGYYSPGFLESVGESAVGIYVSVTTLEFAPSAAYEAFLDTYRYQYGEEPQSEYHGYSYDATMLLLKAISKAAVQLEDGTLIIDPYAVREAFYTLEEYTGLTGNIDCSPLGDCSTGAIGKVYEFTSGDPDTFNPGPSDLLSSNPSQVWP